MNKVIEIDCSGYENEVDKLYMYCGYDSLDIWQDLARYDDRELQSVYINELLKAIFKEPEYRYSEVIYSDYDDYFIRELCFDMENDSLYVKEKYESNEYDEEIQDYPLVEEIDKNPRLRKEEVNKVINRVGKYSLSNALKTIDDYEVRENRILDALNNIQIESYHFVAECIKKFERIDCIRCSTRELVTSIINKACKKGGSFKVLVLYNALFNLNELVNYIDSIKNLIIHSTGFIVHRDGHYEKNRALWNYHRDKSELDFIAKEKYISLENVNHKVLDKIKKYISNKDAAYISFIEKSRFSEELDSENKLKKSDKKAPFIYYGRRFDRYVDKENLQVVKSYNNSNVSLTKPNIMHYEVLLTPKVYAPSTKYILELSFSFERTPRMQYLIDFEDERLTKEDIEHTKIHINHIKIIDERYKDLELEED